MNITIIGLGYVGLPLACLISKQYNTYGIDLDKNKVELINKKISPIKDPFLEKEIKNSKINASTNFKVVEDSDVVIICVPTPVDSDHNPDLSFVTSACEEVALHLKDGALVVIESTIFPGTCEEVIKPILDKTGKKYYLAHCPERIDPGNKKWNVSNLPRVVGALSSEGLRKAAEFYRSILSSEVVELSNVKAAESVKIMENTFRDVNIAFMNEMAKSFDRLGVDITEVIKGASSKPFAFMPHYPGCGVGGHCIAVDPYYLISKAKKKGFHHDFLSLARRINNSMPEYTVELLIEELNKIEKSINNARVGVLGLAYKKNVDDIRESPALKVIATLKRKGANVKVYDPYVKSDFTDIDSLLNEVDYLVLCTDHDEFTNIDLNKLKKIKIVIDGKNCLDASKVKKLGIAYKGIGR